MPFQKLDVIMIVLVQGEVIVSIDVLMIINYYFEGITNRRWSQFWWESIKELQNS
jgi:hypothetical protein